ARAPVRDRQRRFHPAARALVPRRVCRRPPRRNEADVEPHVQRASAEDPPVVASAGPLIPPKVPLVPIRLPLFLPGRCCWWEADDALHPSHGAVSLALRVPSGSAASTAPRPLGGNAEKGGEFEIHPRGIRARAIGSGRRAPR